MSHDLEDALKLLGRVADAFDHPSSRETYKGLTLSSIKTHRPQTSYSSQGNQLQRARFGCCGQSLEGSYIHDDVQFTKPFAVYSNTESCSSSDTVGSLSRDGSPEETSSLFEQDQDSTFDVTKMLLATSPLDRLNYLARMELKRTGWFERSDQWMVVNMGLSDLPSPVTPERPAPADYGISASPIGVVPISDSPAFFSPQSGISIPYPPPGIDARVSTPAKSKYQKRDAEWQKHDPDLDTFESNFPDFSTLSYEKSTHVNIRPKSHKRFGRVKNFVRKILSSSGGDHHSTTNGRHRHSLLVRTPSPRSGGSRASWTTGGWTFASMGSTPAAAPFNNRWSGLWH